MGGSEQAILRVQAGLEEIKKSYSKISGNYAIIEGVFEKGLRQKGLELLDITPGEVVLEIGTGAGYSLKEIADSVGHSSKACGIDITPQMLEITRKRLEEAGFQKAKGEDFVLYKIVPWNIVVAKPEVNS
ncbi:methyltransferase domain-containing protein [Chloroflexota bacterium]